MSLRLLDLEAHKYRATRRVSFDLRFEEEEEAHVKALLRESSNRIAVDSRKKHFGCFATLLLICLERSDSLKSQTC
jgi:hypothetical protein